MDKKPILWILGIVIVVLLVSQTNLFSNTQTFSMDSGNQCTVGEKKCCNTPNVYCQDGTGNIQFSCEQATKGGIWVNHGGQTNNSCMSTQQSCTTGQEKCVSLNYYSCLNNIWVMKGITTGKCGTGTPTIPETPNQETPQTPQENQTPEGIITIPIVNLQVTTTQAAVGGVSLVFLLFLFL
jgi:hypothetical protein